MATAHENLSKLARLALSQNKLAKIWANNTGTAKSITGDRVIAYGLKGSSDNIGIARDGKFIAVEIKTGKDVLRPEQIAFRDLILENNGYHFVIRSEKDIGEMVNEIRSRISRL